MNQLRQAAYFFLGVLVFGLIVYFLNDLLVWLVLAWVVSLLGFPIMHVLGKIGWGNWRLSSPLKAGITLLIFVASLVLFVSLFVPTIVKQSQKLSSVKYAEIIHHLDEPIDSLYNQLAEWGMVDPYKKVKQDIDTLPKFKVDSPKYILLQDSGKQSIHLYLMPEKSVAAIDTVKKISLSPHERFHQYVLNNVNPSAMLSGTATALSSWLGSFFVLLSSVMFIAFFFLQDEGMFVKILKAPFSEKYDVKIERSVILIRDMLVRYFEGILAQMGILTIFLWILLYFLGVENALIIAFFGAIVNVIPYLGPFIGMGFAAIVTLFSSVDLDFYAATVPKLLKVASVFIGMQLFDNLLVQPYIFSKSVKAHPIEIFLVIVIGSKLGGILGMVVAIPFYTAIRVIASIFLSEFKVVQYFAEQLEIRKYNLLDAQYKNTDPSKRYLSNDMLSDKSGWKEGKKE